MNSKLHDEARVVSAKFELLCERPEVLKTLLNRLAAGMNTINLWADDCGVIIGHLKGYVTWNDEAVMLSTTGEEIQVKGLHNYPDAPCVLDVGLAAIVFGARQGEMEKQLEGLIATLFDALAARFSIEYESDHAHRHDHAHHHDHAHDGESEICTCGESGHNHGHEHG